VDKLSGLSGADFDKAYVSDMVSDHEEDLPISKNKPIAQAILRLRLLPQRRCRSSRNIWMP